MAKSSKLRIMISSRCNDQFPASGTTTLSDVRKELKAEVEAMKVASRKAFEVWINEDTAPQAATQDSWDACIQAVRECDILIVVSNGNAGWAKESGDIGICHAELMTGLSLAPAKVRLIALDNVPVTNSDEGERNRRFQKYLETQSLFRGGPVATVADLKARVKDALHDAVIRLTQAGAAEASKGKSYTGASLDWTRMDFKHRQEAMALVVSESLADRHGSSRVGDKGDKVVIKLAGRAVLTVISAIPAALSVPPARELVGRPFLHDHTFSPLLSARCGGPLHVIACHKTATESQADKLLGFQDATVVAAPFGIFVADEIGKVQFAFITNCRNEMATRHGVQRFMEWLEQSGESKLVASRARARARIVQAIAKEAPRAQ